MYPDTSCFEPSLHHHCASITAPNPVGIAGIVCGCLAGLFQVGPIYLGGIGEDVTTRFQGAYAKADTRHLHYFTGQIADFRLWQSIKTAADIDREQLAALDETAADLIAYLPLAEGEGREWEFTGRSGTKAHGQLQENNMALANGGRAEVANAYSHYVPAAAEGQGPLSWPNYVYNGRLYLTDPDSGIGVTIFSRHPENQDTCYVLRRDQVDPAFRLVAP